MAADVEPTDDPTEGGHWIVVDGRRWRATDPTIPGPLRQELVDVLMAARRAIAAAHRNDDAAAEQMARAQVQDAKTALGERGEPWWSSPTDEGRRNRTRCTIRALAGWRGPDRTICPSDVARAIGGERWRNLMTVVRDEARDLAERGVVEVSQGGELLDPRTVWKGPIRIRRVD